MTTLPEEAVKAMPERIFAKVHGASTDLISGQRGLIGGWNEHKRDGQIEYLRSDLIATYQAAALAQAIQIAERPVIGFSDGAVEASRYIASSISALTAALPFIPVQGVVKKLEWTRYEDSDRSEAWEANTQFSGCYVIKRGLSGYTLTTPDADEEFETLEAAKAAAQADYEARILSALEPSTERELALEEVKLERSIERWRNMKPSEVIKGSTAQITYALEDARKDILALAATHPSGGDRHGE